MRTPKEIFKELVAKAQDWRIWKGYGPNIKLNEYQRNENAKEVGKFVTRLPKEDRDVLVHFTIDDFKNERTEDPIFRPTAPKRKRSAAIRLVVNNDKND